MMANQFSASRTHCVLGRGRDTSNEANRSARTADSNKSITAPHLEPRAERARMVAMLS